VYLIESLLIGGYKIGKTTNPEKRFKQLQIPAKAKVVGCWSLSHMSEVEKYWHRYFDELRVPQSEWFDLSDKDVKKFCASMTNKYHIAESSPFLVEFLKQERERKAVAKPVQQSRPPAVQDQYKVSEKPQWTEAPPNDQPIRSLTERRQLQRQARATQSASYSSDQGWSKPITYAGQQKVRYGPPVATKPAAPKPDFSKPTVNNKIDSSGALGALAAIYGLPILLALMSAIGSMLPPSTDQPPSTSTPPALSR
jgi:hypothetical protein